eukprot:scaffold249306_cov73-Cyclotella_meneghiniana.AAC.11
MHQDTELATEVEKTIQQADGSAYMAIFVSTSSSSTPPARYFKDARVEIERCAKTMDEIANMIDTELATEVEKTIQQADGSAYMAIFTTTSTSGVPPGKYFKDAKVEIERCAKTLDELAVMIGMKS